MGVLQFEISSRFSPVYRVTSSKQTISTPGRAKPVSKALQDARDRAEKAKGVTNDDDEAKDDAQEWMNGVDANPREGAAGLERFSSGAGRHGDFENI